MAKNTLCSNVTLSYNERVMNPDPNDMGKALAKLPSLEKSGLSIDVEGVCLCGKKVLMSPDGMEVVDTGLFKAINHVCKGCRKGREIDRTHARLVCARCRRVLAHPEPMRDPRNGFSMEAGRCYHTDGCAICRPPEGGGQGQYPIIEALVYMKRRRNG